MERLATFWAYICAGLSVLFGGITLEVVAVWVGILTAIGTFVINWYYKRLERKDRLAGLEALRGNQE